MKIISRVDAKRLGLKRYCTGKPCPNGHISERFTSNYACEACLRETPRDLVEKRDNERRRYHESIEAAREKNRLKERRRRARNPDHVRALDRASKKALREANREAWRRRKREQAKRARERNPERIKEQYRNYWLKNREAYRANTRGYRARKKSAAGSHTANDIARIRRQQADRCACCNLRLKGQGHVDHIVAIVNGGSNWPANLQILCARCNVSKGRRDPIEFMQSRGRLL